MSYNLSAFAVDFGRLRSAVGSGDQELLGRVLAACGGDLDELDGDDEDYRADDETYPTGTDAMRHLILGGEMHPDAGFKYGYALYHLCVYLGEWLDSSEFESMRWAWFEAVDRALGGAGVPAAAFRTGVLHSRGSPVPIPPPTDFPGIGHLAPEEVSAALAALEAAEPGKCSDGEAAEAIGQVRGWLRACREFGRGLVCFYF